MSDYVLRSKIWTTLNDLYSVKLFAQSWIICNTALHDLCNLEWFLLRWMISTMLNDFLIRCKICTTSNDLYSQGIIQRWKICTTLNDSECDGWFVQRWIIWTTINCWLLVFLMSVRCAYSRKYCKIFCTNLWFDFFLIWKYQEYSALPHKLVI